MQVQFDVENIKCGGCAGTIKKKLMEDQRISHVGVNIDRGVVIIDADTEAADDWRTALLNMGYPEKGSAEGIAAAKARAKSFVSCAVGRVDQVLNK